MDVRVDSGAPSTCGSLHTAQRTPVRPGIGLWRSLVAHLTGGQGVAGSNPVSPTVKSRKLTGFRDFLGWAAVSDGPHAVIARVVGEFGKAERFQQRR